MVSRRFLGHPRTPTQDRSKSFVESRKYPSKYEVPFDHNLGSLGIGQRTEISLNCREDPVEEDPRSKCKSSWSAENSYRNDSTTCGTTEEDGSLPCQSLEGGWPPTLNSK